MLVQQKTTRNSEVYHSQVQEELYSTPQGATQRSQGRVQAESAGQNLRHTPLLRSEDGVLWGSLAKDGLINSNQKEQGLLCITGI